MNIKKLVAAGNGAMQKLDVEEIDIRPDELGTFSGTGRDWYYYVVSGYGRLQVDAYGYSLAPQSGVYIPESNDHSIRNTGHVDMKIVRYSTPA